MTSGDLLADRRLEMARALMERGDVSAAIELLEQALERACEWAAGHFLLGEWRDGAGDRDGAVEAYSRALALDPQDRAGAILRLALIGAAAMPDAPPPAYVAGVFDDHAEDFDSALVERLGYTVPRALADLVAELAYDDGRFARVLDLGCGTGLAGERFRDRAAWLEGVDLSEGMVAVARRKGFYDALAVDEAHAFLAGVTACYDLIVAADVLVYLGDLAGLFQAARRALLPGGRFAFSVEQGQGDGFVLNRGHRYAHGENYVAAGLAAAGLTLVEMRHAVCRMEGGQPVEGLLVLAERSRADGAADISSPGLLAGVGAIRRNF
jgi:predicted TPR repeat methyltransferase